jgi:hypothetical protein
MSSDNHHHPHVPIFCKSGSIDLSDVTIDLFQLFCHTYILAASEITATEESQKFLHRSEGVSAPHRNHCRGVSLKDLAFHCEKRGLLRLEGVSDPMRIGVVGYRTRLF